MYVIAWSKRSTRSLEALPAAAIKRVVDAVTKLAADARPPGSKKLKGSGDWRIRVGNYRVVYEIKDLQLIVLILDIGDRKDIYR